MNIQLYYSKKNFDVQKAQRWFKERRVSFTEVDLKKHKLGGRELDLFARAAGGFKALVDPEAKGGRADYIKQLSIDSVLRDELMENPAYILGPIIRDGNKAFIGFDPSLIEAWIEKNK